MILNTSNGTDNLVISVQGQQAGSAVVEALRINGVTGKVTLAVGLAGGQRFQDHWDKPAADGAAGTATTEHTFLRAVSNITIKSVKYIPDAALTANDTAYATLTVSRRNSAGTGAVTVATITTQIAGGSGNWTGFVPVNLTLSAANLSVEANQILTVAIAKTGAGVAVPAGTLAIEYELA